MKPELIKIALDRVLGESYTDRYKQLLALEIADELDELIKTIPKPDIVQFCRAVTSDAGGFIVFSGNSSSLEPNMRLVFDGETHKLKSAEVIK